MVSMLTACDNQSEIGVVARVNGEPITMHELQARHDLDHMAWSDRTLPPAEELQSQYGDSLGSLIINALVMQELEEEELEVTNEEMLLAERGVSVGYAEEEFEETLEDDAINIEIWRDFLRQRLSVQKFMQTVLRPGIRVSPEESIAYYNANIEQFSLPIRFHFLILEAQEEASLQNVLKRYNEKSENIAQIMSANNSDVIMREVRMSEDRLPPQWRDILKELKQGKATKVSSSPYGFEFIILISRQDETELTLAQAYPLIERELVEQKLESTFQAWIEEKLSESEIQIAEPLAEIWVSYRLNPVSNSTYPKEMPWLDIVEEDYGSDDDSFEGEEGEEPLE